MSKEADYKERKMATVEEIFAKQVKEVAATNSAHVWGAADSAAIKSALDIIKSNYYTEVKVIDDDGVAGTKVEVLDKGMYDLVTSVEQTILAMFEKTERVYKDALSRNAANLKSVTMVASLILGEDND